MMPSPSNGDQLRTSISDQQAQHIQSAQARAQHHHEQKEQAMDDLSARYEMLAEEREKLPQDVLQVQVKGEPGNFELVVTPRPDPSDADPAPNE